MAETKGLPEEIQKVRDRVQTDWIDPNEPGLQLPDEEDLATTYEVDRPTVREALVQLEGRRLLERRPKGAYVVGRLKKYRRDDLRLKEIGVSFAKAHAAFKDRAHFGIIDGIFSEIHLGELGLMMPTTDWRWLGKMQPAEFFQAEHVAGILLIDKHHPDILASLKSLQRPMVAVDHNATSDGIDSFEYANEEAGTFLAGLLAQLGHKRVIGVFESLDRPIERQDPTWTDRREGFLKEWREKTEVEPEVIGLADRGQFEPALSAIDEYLQRPPEKRPTAVVLPGPGSLEAVRDVAAHRGLQIPKDLTVVGFGNFVEQDEMSSIRFDGREIGQKAAENMLNIVCGHRPPHQKPLLARFKGQYIPGETHARVPQ